MKVKVKKKDIKRGVPWSSEEHPTAKAVARLPSVFSAWLLSDSSIAVDFPDGREIELSLPENIAIFNKRFDNKEKVEPVSFDLGIEAYAEDIAD